MIVSSPNTLPSPPWQVPCFPSSFLCWSVPDAFIDWNILMVDFLRHIDNGSSQFLLLYDLCPHRPMICLFPNSANVICTRAVKEWAWATQAEGGHLPSHPHCRPWLVLLDQPVAWSWEDVGMFGLFVKVISSNIMDGKVFCWFLGLARIRFSW